ncbi:DUF434 domain-containing protein [Schaedlerella arabinosiphila]|uniref:DUF434 domain-containing protein n=1 Tax=Schaedlerella arabinosiphila TaxID=2044587 RepID=UPI002557F63C|nr:DUF434 domain-containing protein [Schaedlerella arabinosiphila]
MEREKKFIGRRGYVPEDEIQFSGRQLELLQKAADEVQFLLDQGYNIKPVTTFVGNHYMFSERQRLALARSVSAKEYVQTRISKELLQNGKGMIPKLVHIDGFNTIITLEVVLSGSPILYCRDGVIRDLAGLRGTYRIIDKSQEAVELLLGQLESLNISDAVFYLDAPVSNSGRLSELIRQCAKGYSISVQTQIIPDVDRVLEQMEGVISGDAIIINRCKSWLNVVSTIVEQIESVWKIQL